jgi:hypothetical protein
MSMEPGLSSPATFRSLPERPSSRLTVEDMRVPGQRVKPNTARPTAKINYPEDVVLYPARSSRITANGADQTE